MIKITNYSVEPEILHGRIAVRGEPETSSAARNMLVEVLSRTGAAVLLGVFAYAAIMHWRTNPGRVTLLLIVIAECFTVGLSLFTRVPVRRDWTPFAFLCSMGATYYFMAVNLGPGVPLLPEAVGAGLQVVGLCVQIFAKASLRRSFGILPANRGVVTFGAYKFVRHPMYLGYFITDVGFLLVNFGAQNLLVYGVQFAMQAGRIMREEQILCGDANYRAYQGKVRFRIIPGLF